MDYEPIPKSEYVGDLFARLTEIFSDSSDLIVAKAHGFNLPPVGDEETVLCEVDDPIIPRLCLLLERIGEYASGIVPDNINNKLAFDVWMGKQTVDRARFLDDQFARVNEMINLVNGLNEIAMRDAVGANCPRVIGLRQGWQVVTIKKFAH